MPWDAETRLMRLNGVVAAGTLAVPRLGFHLTPESTLRLQDGGDGDADGIANGIIVDPSGVGISASSVGSGVSEGVVDAAAVGGVEGHREVLNVEHGHQRSFGSSASRRPSPKKLKAITMTITSPPGLTVREVMSSARA